MAPISVVIPTIDRTGPLARTLDSLLASTLVPQQFVIVDASADREAAMAAQARFDAVADGPQLIIQRAAIVGAAAQRNQAVPFTAHDYVLFCDDDVLCEPDCVERLWNALQDDESIGAAGAAIVNQSYVRPGFMTRLTLMAMGEREGGGYAGRIMGPAVAFLPALAARDTGNAAVPVQWLNLACTLYRKSLLPQPTFGAHFHGYSLGEDVSLSLNVGRKARLVNVPDARIFHDSQPGAHKAHAGTLSRMDVVNRHAIMTSSLGHTGWRGAAKLLLWEAFQLASCAWQQRCGTRFWQSLRGTVLGFGDVLRQQPVRGR